jgi:hypothetical protein
MPRCCAQAIPAILVDEVDCCEIDHEVALKGDLIHPGVELSRRGQVEIA